MGGSGKRPRREVGRDEAWEFLQTVRDGERPGGAVLPGLRGMAGAQAAPAGFPGSPLAGRRRAAGRERGAVPGLPTNTIFVASS